MKHFVNIPRAAEAAGVSRDVLHYWIRIGVLPSKGQFLQRRIAVEDLTPAKDLMAQRRREGARRGGKARWGKAA